MRVSVVDGGVTSREQSFIGSRSVRIGVALTVLAIFGAACGRGAGDSAASATPASTALPSTTTTAAAVNEVDIRGFMFQPNPLRIAVGTTVQWTNQDEILHTVTSGMRTYDEQHLQKDIIPGPPGFDFQLDGKGRTATFTFSQAGSFSYLCSRHPGMDAQIVVG
jgi:plastocyanin